MGIISSIKELPILVLVALILLFIANLLNEIAFSTTTWGETFYYMSNTLLVVDQSRTYTNHGLWRECTGTQNDYILYETGSCSDTLTGTAAGWMAATQALACLGLMGLVLAFVLLLVFINCKNDDGYLLVAAIICLLTGVLYLIGIIVYGYHFMNTPITVTVSDNAGRKLGWSFGLAVVSILLELVAGVLLMLGRNASKTSPA